MTPPASLLSQVEAGIAWITLNRPDQRNALDIPSLKNLHALLDAHNADPAVRVLVLTTIQHTTPSIKSKRNKQLAAKALPIKPMDSEQVFST